VGRDQDQGVKKGSEIGKKEEKERDEGKQWRRSG
jgi:hypothetical protein